MTEQLEKLTQEDGKSLDLESQNIEQLKQLFPDVFREGKVDFDALKAVLGEHVEDNEERYNFTWHGKNRARQIAQTPSTGTLRPCKEESVNWDTTQNLFIEGDNLEVLKLLQKSYHQKVKMIYIDPPYNTGKDFVYKDNFHDNIKNYLELTSQIDEVGNKTSANTETSGRFHTDWLNMMYPRLKLSRNLLSQDGFIFISMDDCEVNNLKKLCDEVFGEDNFLAQFLWEKRITRENRKAVSVRHDYILCYAKNLAESKESVGLLPMDEAAIGRYKNPDNDPRGVWTSVPAIAQGGHGTSNQFYTLTTPNGRVIDPPSGSCWRYTQNKMNDAIADNKIWFGSDGNGVPRIKKFLTEGRQGLTPETIWWAKDVGSNDSAKRELVDLFDGKAVFDTPKPSLLIERMMDVANIENDYVLDFFAGSGPTASAVMNRNVQKEQNNKFICVQLPEVTDTKSEARKAGYETISSISMERIRRKGMRVKEEEESNIDFGFKAFKLESSNINQWEPDFDNLSDILDNSVDSIKAERTREDVLYEILLKYGLDLTYPITEHSIAEKTVYDVAFGSLIVCLDDGITREVVEGIGKLKQELDSETTRVVFKDAGFADDSVKVNAIQMLKQYGVDDVKSI